MVRFGVGNNVAIDRNTGSGSYSVNGHTGSFQLTVAQEGDGFSAAGATQDGSSVHIVVSDAQQIGFATFTFTDGTNGAANGPISEDA